jgi:hypothetical protein
MAGSPPRRFDFLGSQRWLPLYGPQAIQRRLGLLVAVSVERAGGASLPWALAYTEYYVLYSVL